MSGQNMINFPGSRRPTATPLRRPQLDLVEQALALPAVGAPDPDGRDVGQDGDVVLGRELRVPPELGVLVQPEGEVVLVHVGHGVVLVGDGERDPRGLGAPALDDDVLEGRPHAAPLRRLEGELELLVVAGPLVAQVERRRQEVAVLGGHDVGVDPDELVDRVVLQGQGLVPLHRCPIFAPAAEVALQHR